MDALTDYFLRDMDKQEAKLLKLHREIGCSICGSHNLGWIPVNEEDIEDWEPMEYPGCLNCIEISESFTTA
jgi:hypothetical protein